MIGKAVAERVKALGMAGGAIPCLGDNPNVIFILADDQGWGDAGYNGHPSARTPNLDRLAADGTVIKNFYVNGTVCSPSRAAFLTGMYPARLGFHHITSKPDVNKQRQVPDWLDPEVRTIADAFKKAGYATAHFGKWHLGKYAGAPAATAYGFDESAVTSGSGEQVRTEGGNEDPFLVTEATFDRAIDFISDHEEQPFYVNVWSPLPHAPLRPSPEQIQAFHDVKPEPASFGRWMTQAEPLRRGNPRSVCCRVAGQDPGRASGHGDGDVGGRSHADTGRPHRHSVRCARHRRRGPQRRLARRLRAPPASAALGVVLRGGGQSRLLRPAARRSGWSVEVLL